VNSISISAVGHLSDANLRALFDPSKHSLGLAADRATQRIRLRKRRACVAAILSRRQAAAFLKTPH
jgi:hypothetical protein